MWPSNSNLQWHKQDGFRKCPNTPKIIVCNCCCTYWKLSTFWLRSPLWFFWSQTWAAIMSQTLFAGRWGGVGEAAVVFRPAVNQYARRKTLLLFQTTNVKKSLKSVWKVSLCEGHRVQIQQENQWEWKSMISDTAAWFWTIKNEYFICNNKWCFLGGFFLHLTHQVYSCCLKINAFIVKDQIYLPPKQHKFSRHYFNLESFSD